MKGGRDMQRSREKKHHKSNQFENNKHRFRSRPKQQIRQEKYKSYQLAKINRNQVCPFLAQVYYCINGANNYQKITDLPKDRKLILYLWMDSTLKQITEILRAYLPAIRTKQRFVFRKVSVQNELVTKKQMGIVLVHTKVSENQEVRLDSKNFFIGDIIDVSINYK